MSLHHLSRQQTSPRRIAFAIFGQLALAVGFTSSFADASAAEPAPAAPAGITDVVLARSALAALDAEPELRGVNLVVSVVNGVAVLGGPVPSAAVSKHAEKVIRTVEGMKEVRNTCFVSTGPDPFLKAVADRSGSTRPQRPVMAELPGVLGTPPPAPASPFPVRSNPAGTGPNTVVIARRPPLPAGSSSGVLGAPVGPAGVGTGVVPVSGGAPAGTLTGASAASILSAAAEIKKSEARFAKLTVEIQEAVVVVSGTAPRAADAWDLAQKLRRIPGVSRVAIGAVVEK